MAKDKYYGKTLRKNFARHEEVMAMPNLLEIQKKSYQWFLDIGLREVFVDVASIEDYAGNLELSFIDYSMDEKPKYDVEECKARDATYAAPMKVRVRLHNKETGEIKESEIFMGDFPLMTDGGTFVINGAERVEYETDTSEVFWVRIDKNRKLPITCLIRALGLKTDAEIMERFGDDRRIVATLEKDTCKTYEEAMLEIYRKLRPGEPPTLDSAETLLQNLFFDPRRYDLSTVGRYKFNKKLTFWYRAKGQKLAMPVADPATGEILFEDGHVLTADDCTLLDTVGVYEISVALDGGETIRIFTNKMCDMSHYVDFDPREQCGIKERVRYDVLQELLGQYKGEELIEQCRLHADELVPKHIIVDDIFASINYMNALAHGLVNKDDIDHLGNRRVRSVGELLQNQFRIGIARLERVIRERMAIQEIDKATPQSLINVRPVSSAIKEFFGSSQLSQFMDQSNPIAELTHKRKLSALGPGGLNRERATFDVRDVHYSHYGRMCPIETPEGQNIGLITSLAAFARINEYGFVESPYRRVDKERKVVTDEIEYLTADREDGFIVAQANELLDENGWFVKERVTCRYREDIKEFRSDMVDYMDVSPKQLVSVATSLIPFLENDDTNRALMGSNMQRQAVPLLKPEAPIVATGIEHRIAYDSGVMVISKEDGVVNRVSADKIEVRDTHGLVHSYPLKKFVRSNQGTCINQRPIVNVGQVVKAGDIIADGPSTSAGELSLGRNILIGFMSWEGYNYEDAILISENLVKEDVFTSIHIEEHETETRDTKLGPEEITRDIPNVGEDALKDLDEEGIIRIGAEVHPGDILVGKVTPKGEAELTPEERLLRAIFSEKAREVRDTSLRVPNGEEGIVVDIKIFTRENKDELDPGVNKLVRVYIAQKRKISVGDKMAGRHGNKGVISRILPQEDMPFMEDGTPLQIVLNPLGVPSRMNIGQVLEVHLGLVAKLLGWKVATPVFDGATETDIKELFEQNCMTNPATNKVDGKVTLYDGRTGLPFENRVTVGYMYMLKLIHLVDDKIHARSTGPYSLVTQQPLGGKAQFGGQRFGEMEVWALEAYGASNILQEILTVKSDDVVGRVKTYESIVKGDNISDPGIPESFKVLIKELQGLALDVKVLSEDNEEIQIIDSSDTELDYADFINKAKEEKKEKILSFDENEEIDILADDFSFDDEEMDEDEEFDIQDLFDDDETDEDEEF